LSPVTSTTLILTVTDVPDLGGGRLMAQLFPSGGMATRAQSPSEPSSGRYSWRFELDEPMFAGYVRVWIEGSSPLREIVSDYTVVGSPASGWGHGAPRDAPRGSPASGWGHGAPVISSDGQVLLFSKNLDLAKDQFVSLQATNSITATPPWATVVGQAYRLVTNVPSLPGMSINFSYLGREVPPGEESGLRVYFWNEPIRQWQVLSTTLNLERNNASALARGPGIYVLMSSFELPIPDPGWNLVAYPAPSRQPMPAALGSIDGAYTTVYGYVITDTADPWKVYDVGVPEEWRALVNDLTELHPGRGYWINTTEPITALLKGGPDPALASLGAAAQLSLPPATYYGIAPAAVSRVGITVQALINNVVCGQAQTTALGGQPRIAFVVHARAAGAGADARCGTPGQPMTIVFLDGARRVAALKTVWDNNRVQELRGSEAYLPFVRR
jgi:hypothetical protein